MISVILLIIIIALILYFILISKDDCEKGDNEKCLSCVEKSKDCKICNPYFRLKNGK
jgi:nitric oxide reductase large subunit